MATNRVTLTVPNIVTAGRALAIPWVFILIVQNPGGNWWIAALCALTDNIDGALARLEDKGTRWKELGFSRSETGRWLDPVVDKLFMAAILIAGLISGVVPAWLATIWLAQRCVLAVTGLLAAARYPKLRVSRTGKYGEFLTDTGVLGLLAIHAVTDPPLREALQEAGQLIILGGLGLATLATYQYARQSGLVGSRPPDD